MLLTDFIAELAHFPICPRVTPIGMVVYKIDSVKDDVIMAMPLVDVGSDHILILAFQPFVGKLLADLMRLFRRDLTDVEGLNQVSGNHPVSYTHLDVYKRQGINRKLIIGADELFFTKDLGFDGFSNFKLASWGSQRLLLCYVLSA